MSFQYPPDGTSSGVLRTLKHTRYLPDHGWRVSVLSPDVAAYETVDPASLRDVPDGVAVVRTRYLDTKRHLGVKGSYLALMALPDRFIGWWPWALAAGLRIARRDPVDLVYSTSPPATAHVVARSLARRLRVPWVTDFRDPWFEDPPEPGAPAGRLFRALDRRLEAGVVRDCSHVVATTRQQRDMLASRHGGQPASKFSVIPNGYDEADFSALPALGVQRKGERLRIVHAGSINPEFRDPVPLFAAIRRCAAAGRLDVERLELCFLGGGAYAESAVLRRAAAEHGLADCVSFVQRVPYAEALRMLSEADVLLLLQASDDTRALVPAKLYEYLRMRKPVLALTLPGETSAVLAQTGGGHAVEPADADGLADALAALYRQWAGGTLGECLADPRVLQRWDRRALAAELAAVFDRAVAAPAAAEP